MKLNIFLISHPLIKLFTKQITIDHYYNKKTNNFNKYTYQYIGTFLIYEVLRKFLIIKNLYIDKIDHTQEIYCIDKGNK